MAEMKRGDRLLCDAVLKGGRIVHDKHGQPVRVPVEVREVRTDGKTPEPVSVRCKDLTTGRVLWVRAKYLHKEE